MLIVGTGGQGQITLLQILAEAALIENLDFKSSELHGLSQRGGSVEVHIRFGKKIYSPMVPARRADLILGLEMQESLMAANFASPKTNFLVNKHIVPIPFPSGARGKKIFISFDLPSVSEGGRNLAEKQILTIFKKISNNINLISAEKICQEKLGSSVVAGVYLVSLAAFKNLIPIKPDSILKAMGKIIPRKYLKLNLKAFKLASESEAVK